MKIGVDLDGVCCNFVLHFSKLYRKIYGNEYPLLIDKEQISDWDFKFTGLSDIQINGIFDRINFTNDFWYTIPTLDINNFKYFRDKFNMSEVYFITSRKNGRNIFYQTIRWLEDKGWRYPQLILSNNKSDIIADLNIEYFIDDSGETCNEILCNPKLYDNDRNYKVKTCIMDYPHNRQGIVSEEIGLIKRVNNLREFTDYILKEKK